MVDETKPETRFENLCRRYFQEVYDIEKAGNSFASHNTICTLLGIDRNGEGAQVKDHLHNTFKIAAQAHLVQVTTPFGVEYQLEDYRLTCR